VFLYTRYSPPASRIAARSSARSLTVNPRYSVNSAASAVANLSRTSSTTATLLGFGFSMGTSFLDVREHRAPRTADAQLDRKGMVGAGVSTYPGGLMPFQSVSIVGTGRRIDADHHGVSGEQDPQLILTPGCYAARTPDTNSPAPRTQLVGA